MREETRIVQIYVRAEGPDEPRFGDEIDDDAVSDYAYDGWLPLTLSPRDEDGRQHATVIATQRRLPTRERRRSASARPSTAPSCGSAHGSDCATSSRRHRKSAASRTTATKSQRTSPKQSKRN